MRLLFAIDLSEVLSSVDPNSIQFIYLALNKFSYKYNKRHREANANINKNTNIFQQKKSAVISSPLFTTVWNTASVGEFFISFESVFQIMIPKLKNSCQNWKI